MKALTYSRYGPPDVVEIQDVPRPETGPKDVLVRVVASAVNTGDWRIRAADFPGILVVPGRLMFGFTKPRNRRLGMEFAGTVEAVGPDTTRFAVGDRVFGFASKGGASAEYLAVAEESAVAPMSSNLSFDEGAALPFGGLAALAFLTDFGALKADQDVLIVGASGGVGVHAVQIAKAFGARVTGVAGPDNQTFIMGLGADQAVDYTKTDLEIISERFDVILDVVGVLPPKAALRLLKPSGVFLPLNMGLPEIGAALLNVFRSRKVKLAVNEDTAEGLAQLTQLIDDGKLKPVIDSVFPLERAREAHARVESRHKRGSVVLRVSSEPSPSV